MHIEDDDVASFLACYAEACAELGVAPLPSEAVAVLAEALLASIELAGGSRSDPFFRTFRSPPTKYH